MKDSRIVVPVEELEKAMIEAKAKDRGFDSVASYVRWLIRQDAGKE